MKARQGRFAEAEVDARRALLSQSEKSGQIQSRHATLSSWGLADILVEQGRYAEAEQLARVSLEISRNGRRRRGLRSSNVQQLSQLGGILNLAAQGPGRDRDLCADRQGYRQLGAGAAAGVRTEWRADYLTVCLGADRGRHRRGRATVEAAGCPGSARIISMRPRRAARLAVGLMRARERCGCDPRIQGGDPDPDGGLARERR